LTALPAGGQPRARDGIRKPQHHGIRRRSHRVPDLARRFQITGVPKTIVNQEIEILGALPEDAFVEQALAQFAASNREPR
jgi:predicted DsbA family dithiol-disulfide isomerase